MSNQKETDACFPIMISDNGRYFVDSQNKPFFWHADTCWKLFWEFTREEAVCYLANRAAMGFTVIQVQLLPHRNYQANRDGELPFQERGNIKRINEPYFSHVDWVIKKAAEYGLALMIAPIWLSGWEQDWHKSFNVESAVVYSTFVASRYVGCDNIIGWIHGGDDDAIPLHAAVRASASVFKKIAPRQLNTFHAWAKGGWMFFHSEDWYDFHMAYSYSYPFLLQQLKEARKLEPHKPVVLGETHYEGNEGITSGIIRRYAYTALLCGLAGHTYGHKDIWIYTYFWKDALCSEASHHMRNLITFIDMIPWWNMVPARNGELLRTQEDVLKKFRTDVDSEEIPTATSRKEEVAVAYLSDHREFFIDPFWQAERFISVWFDPVSGQYHEAIPDTNVAYRTPGVNAGGGKDWIFLICTQRTLLKNQIFLLQSRKMGE